MDCVNACRYFQSVTSGSSKSSDGRSNHVYVRQNGYADCYWLSATLLE